MDNTTNIKITISWTKFKDNYVEISKLYKIVTDSDDNCIKYIYILFYTSSKTYDIYVSFLTKPMHCNQDRIRSSIYKWTNNQCIIQDTYMSNKELYEFVLFCNDPVIHVYPIKPIQVKNIKLSLLKCVKMFHRQSRELNKISYNLANHPINQPINQEQHTQPSVQKNEQQPHKTIDNSDTTKSSGIYLIDSVKHFKLGSSCNIYKRLCTHSTSLGIPNVHLIVYTKDYKLLETVLLHKFKNYLVSQDREIINSELININAIIYDIIYMCDVLDIDYTVDYNYKFVKKQKSVVTKRLKSVVDTEKEAEAEVVVNTEKEVEVVVNTGKEVVVNTDKEVVVNNKLKHRGKNMEKIWFDDDYSNGNKLYIAFEAEKHLNTNYIKLFGLVSSLKPGFLEYMHIVYTQSKYEIFAKYKHYIKPIHKASLRKLLFQSNNDMNNIVESVTKDKLTYIREKPNVIFFKGPAYKLKGKIDKP